MPAQPPVVVCGSSLWVSMLLPPAPGSKSSPAPELGAYFCDHPLTLTLSDQWEVVLDQVSACAPMRANKSLFDLIRNNAVTTAFAGALVVVVLMFVVALALVVACNKRKEEKQMDPEAGCDMHHHDVPPSGYGLGARGSGWHECASVRVSLECLCG